jgi:hypothetical protein
MDLTWTKNWSMLTNDITINDVIVHKFIATNKGIETVNILFIR